LSQKIPSGDWHAGTNNLGQNGLNLIHLWRHPQKCKSKIFLFF